MRHHPISAALFQENRRRLAERLAPRSLAIVNSNDIPPTNADGSLPIVPNSDLFYLTGIEQEESLLVLAPQAHDEARREILFLREPNEHLKIWEGQKHSKEEAQKISGVREVRWLHELPGILHRLVCEHEQIYLNSNEHYAAKLDVESRDLRFVRQLQARYPLHAYRRLAPILHQLRVVKSPLEIELLREACAITRAGFLRVLDFVKPGVNECEVEAEFAHEFIRRRGKFAYNPIIAGGANACTLHYVANDQPLQKGELLLLDVAASYANYNADLTRTIPVNGKFTRRQRQIYDAVLNVLRGVIAASVPGKMHRDWQKESEALMTEQLLELDLLKPRDVKKQDPLKPAVKKYFMHGVGHPLGLDVHDVGLMHEPFAPGWVLTVEPGIYLPDEGFGVRLENDILVTESGPIDLMADIPIEAEEIEALMAKRRSF